jgi:hypothetical protein
MAHVFGEAGLDDLDPFLLQLPDGLEVLLERGVKSVGHPPILQGGSCPPKTESRLLG